MADIEYSQGGTRVRIDGLKAVISKLNKAGANAQDMRELMHSVGSIVIQGANPPTLSGRLAASMRAGRGKTKAVVRAGYASRVPYAGVIHYGWPARNIGPHPFLTDSLRANHGRVFTALEAGIDELLSKNGLK